MLLFSGARHRYLRRLMQPAFTNEAIEGFVPTVIAPIVLRYLERWADAGTAPVYPQLKLLTFEVILQVCVCVCVGVDGWGGVGGGRGYL